MELDSGSRTGLRSSTLLTPIFFFPHARLYLLQRNGYCCLKHSRPLTVVQICIKTKSSTSTGTSASAKTSRPSTGSAESSGWISLSRARQYSDTQLESLATFSRFFLNLELKPHVHVAFPLHCSGRGDLHDGLWTRWSFLREPLWLALSKCSSPRARLWRDSHATDCASAASISEVACSAAEAQSSWSCTISQDHRRTSG